MNSPRIVLCEACGSEGRILRAEYSTDPNPRDCGPCPYCEGTGGEIIETQPVDMDDLDAMAGTAEPSFRCACGCEVTADEHPCNNPGVWGFKCGVTILREAIEAKEQAG